MPAFKTIVTLIGIAFIIVITSLIYYLRKTVNLNLIIAGACFFLLPLLPSLIYKPVFTGFAYDYLDHRMFFPGIGLLLIAYALVEPLLKKNLSVNYLYGLVALMFVVSFVNAKKYKNYTAYYDNATATNPKSGLAWMNYGTMLARENNYDKMFEKFNRALEVTPNNIELRMKLADSYYTIKDYANMEEQCRAVIVIDSTFAKAYFDMALYQTLLKNNDSALHLMNTCLGKNKKNSQAYYFRGLIYKTIQNIDSALVDFQTATALNIEYADAFFEQGHILGNLGKYEQAHTAFDHYLQLNPNDGRGYFYRGQTMCLLKNVTEGCEDLHKALSLGVPDAQAKIDYFCK